VVFLDSETGKPIAPFDTRNFVHKEEDPQIARSSSHETEHDERSELLLPNGWVSQGAGRLPWFWNLSNKVHFFDCGDLKWTVTLPEGTDELSHWRDILVFHKMRHEDRKRTSYLYGQPAGSPSPSWEFTLPNDIPDREGRASHVVGPRGILRDFSYTVGKQSVFVFGNGALFALEPRSGKVLWRHLVRDDRKEGKPHSFDYGEIIEAEANILLASQNLLGRLDESSETKLSVLRRDLYEGLSPVSVGTVIFCFTTRP